MVKKIVFWRVWIITFKVRSLAQSDQTRRVITTFTPFDQVSSRYHLFFSPLFRTNFHPAQKLRYTIFRSFLSVIFFPFFLFLFFFLRLDLQAFENWSRVHNRLSDRRNYIRGSYLPIGSPSNIDFPSRVWQWFAVTVDLSFDKSSSDIGPPCKQKKGPAFHGRARGNDDSRGWLERRGSRMNSKRASRFLFAHGEEGSSPGVFCKEISTDGEGKRRDRGEHLQAAAS